MGLREVINEKPQVVTGVAVGIIAIAVLIMLWQLLRGSSGDALSSSGGRVFYSTDDGATFFADDASRIPPFEARGGQAVRAVVYTCDEGKTRFVGYLERYPPEVAARLADRNRSTTPEDLAAFANLARDIEVKRPGEPNWVSARRPDLYLRVINVTCPPGTTGTPQQVLP